MAIVRLVDLAFQVYWLLLLARIILSWVPTPRSPFWSKAAGLVYDLTEPILAPFRRLLPLVNLGGVGFDLSPIIAFLVLGLVRSLVVNLLIEVLATVRIGY